MTHTDINNGIVIVRFVYSEEKRDSFASDKKAIADLMAGLDKITARVASRLTSKADL